MGDDLDEDLNFRRNYRRIDAPRLLVMLTAAVVVVALLMLFG